MVNDAGVETRASILDTTEQDYDRVLGINLKSAFFGTQFAAKQFIAQGNGGIILNISSVHEEWPMPGNIAYCVSKGGMRMLARTAGVELGEHDIRVVNIGPGAVSTPINTSTMDDPAKLKALERSRPARPDGASRRDRRHGRVPRIGQSQLHDRQHRLPRRRDHAGQRRVVGQGPRDGGRTGPDPRRVRTVAVRAVDLIG